IKIHKKTTTKTAIQKISIPIYTNLKNPMGLLSFLFMVPATYKMHTSGGAAISVNTFFIIY
ncbi:MAG: hypothetical protein RI909_171, partial [Bacteroidota bacterium]